MADAEGVGIDSLAKAGVVKAGPVAGLGDAAYFSDLLPSQVLKGDILVELTMSCSRTPRRSSGRWRRRCSSGSWRCRSRELHFQNDGISISRR